jgi:ComF family protein
MIGTLWQTLWHQTLGSLCVLCREDVTGEHAYRQLCAWCLASLPWRSAPDLDLERPLPGISRAFTPLSYEGAPRAWVLEAKHDRGLIAARTLGILLAESLLDAYPFVSDRPDRLIPMPLSGRRLRRRGHNQAALIATPVARCLDIPIHHRDARRTRHTPLLAELDPEARRRTVSHVFAASDSVAGARIAIVDDVVTTGASACALAAALMEAGAGEVHLWAATAAAHPG